MRQASGYRRPLVAFQAIILVGAFALVDPKTSAGTSVGPWSGPGDCSVLSSGSLPGNDGALAQLVDRNWSTGRGENPFSFDVDRFLEADKKSINSIFEALRVMRARAARSFILAKTVENREAVEAIEKLYDLIQQSSRAEERITWSRIIGLGRRVDHLHKLWILTGDSSALERAQGHLEKLEAILIKLTTLEEESITIASITPHQILAQRQFFEIDGANILSALALEKNDRAVMETAEAHMTSAVQLFEAATPQENYEIGSLIDHLGDLAPQKQSETIKIFFKQQLVLLRRARLDRDAELSAQSAGGFRRLAAAMKETCRGVDRGLAWYYSARAYESSFLWSSELDGNVGAAIRAYESALKDLRHEIAPIYFARTVLAYGQLHDRIGEYLKEKNLPIWQVHHEKAQDAQRAGSAILKSYLDVKE